MSQMNRIEAYYDRKFKLWIVRLEEKVDGNTKEEAEEKASMILQLYQGARGFESTYTDRLDKLREEIGVWKARAEGKSNETS